MYYIFVFFELYCSYIYKCFQGFFLNIVMHEKIKLGSVISSLKNENKELLYAQIMELGVSYPLLNIVF